MYNVGQADNLLSQGKVSYPSYQNGSLEEQDYPCKYIYPDPHKRPTSIPLGTYDDFDKANYVENYVDDTQQKKAGEPSDGMLLLIVFIIVALFILFIKL